MRLRAAAAGLSVVLALAVAFCRQEDEPCLKEWEGQRLSDSLYNVDLMVMLLGRLKGSEDPKLKTLMEMNLQWAARNAVEAIGHGAELASPYAAVNWLPGVRKAQKYAAAHQMEVASVAEGEPTPAPFAQDLATIEAWLEKRK